MPDHFFVYPAYLNRATTRALGRRVPQAMSVIDATVAEIVEAARTLGFTATPEPDKQYPRAAHAFSGRVRIAKKAGVTKTEALRRLGAELTRSRSAEAKP